jgi:hypothetical protein
MARIELLRFFEAAKEMEFYMLEKSQNLRSKNLG